MQIPSYNPISVSFKRVVQSQFDSKFNLKESYFVKEKVNKQLNTFLLLKYTKYSNTRDMRERYLLNGWKDSFMLSYFSPTSLIILVVVVKADEKNRIHQ